MQIIKKLSEMIEEELSDAEKYIRCAEAYKEQYPTLATLFAKLSAEEMTHMSLLHDQVKLIIADYRKEHGEPPERMQGVYDYLHQKFMEESDKIRVMQNLYKS